MRATIGVMVLLLVGCSDGRNQPSFPDLNPVKGTVTIGGKTATGGVVTFHAEPKNEEFLINSEVDGDGSFSLSTVRTTDSRGERKPGVAAGKYTVTYTPPLGDQTAGGSQEPISLPAPVSISGPETNLKIDVPAAKK